MSRGLRWTLVGGVSLFLYGPLAVLGVYSFNASRFGLDWSGFSLRWYRSLIGDAQMAAALADSLAISVPATLCALLLAVPWALRVSQRPGRLGGWELGLLLGPVIVPDILMGVALLNYYTVIGLPRGRLTVVLAHVAYQVSFAVLVLLPSLHRFPRSLLHASRDLGAGYLDSVRRVVLPLIWPGILAAGLVIFALSIDDFLVTFFTAGPGVSTLPVHIYSMIKRGVTPSVNAVSVLLLSASFLLAGAGIGLSLLAGSRSRSGGRAG